MKLISRGCLVKYPKWLPYPSSWLNALLLAGLMSGSVFLVQHLYGNILVRAARTGGFGFAALMINFIILSPILNIAFVHHWIHLLLSRFAPSLQAPEIGKVSGFMPTLFSWWEGLMGWTVMMVALLVNFSVYGLFVDWSWQPSESITNTLGSLFTFTWLTCSAYLYHCF
jgi:hypothetical protein